MADDEVDFWTATVQALAPLQLRGPELTVKLLKRPPFRFIHDIVTSINARFAAYDHIFTPEQLDATKIDTKEKKIEYLTTLVKYVSQLLGKKIDVHVKKIITGSEPEKTNVFIQSLALAVGYAQQDKAQRAQGSTQQEPQQQEQKEVNYPAHPELPPRNSLLKRQSQNPALLQSQREALKRESIDFYEKMHSYGALQLDQASSQTVKDVGRSIVQMYKELQVVNTATQPTPLPVDALEMAIKRQLDAIRELAALQEENDAIVDKLEAFLAS